MLIRTLQCFHTVKLFPIYKISLPVRSGGRVIRVLFQEVSQSPESKGIYDFSYTPTGVKGMAETPLHMNQVCYGLDLRQYDVNLLRKSKQVNIQWMMELYKAYPYKEKFFNSKLSKEMGTIEKLVGSGLFRQQIIDGNQKKKSAQAGNLA